MVVGQQLRHQALPDGTGGTCDEYLHQSSPSIRVLSLRRDCCLRCDRRSVAIVVHSLDRIEKRRIIEDLSRLDVLLRVKHSQTTSPCVHPNAYGDTVRLTTI